MNKEKYLNAFDKIKHNEEFFDLKMRMRIGENINAFITPSSIEGLIDLIEHTGIDDTSKVVEVGSYYGASTVMFAVSGAKVDSIDCWSNDVSDINQDGNKMDNDIFNRIEKCYDENIKNYPNINKVKSDARLVIDNYEDKSLDLVYIDANHNYEDVKKDLLMWEKKVKDGGWLCGHDYTLIGVIQAISEIFGINPVTFDDSSWAIKLDKNYENNINVWIGTGITSNYIDKSMQYLVSLNAYNNLPFYKKFCVTLGFHIPDHIKNSLPNINFIYKDMYNQLEPNKNNCMQHGEFLDVLNANDKDIIIFTDSDIIIQSDVMVWTNCVFNAIKDNQVMVGFNQDENDTLLKEYYRTEPVVDFKIIEDRLSCNLMKLKCYNTGVIITNYKTYKNIFEKYCEMFPTINSYLNHYAKQQFLLSYIFQKHFKIKNLNKAIHTHGHAGIPNWVRYDYSLDKYLIKSTILGNTTSYDVPVIFRHALPKQKIMIRQFRAEDPHKGAAYYRIDIPYENLLKSFNYKYDIDVNNSKDLHLADIVVCQRAMSQKLYAKIRNSIKPTAKIIWDGDDDYFNVDDKNPNCNSFKEENIIDGIRTFIKNSDLITTSTEYLRDTYSKYTKKPIEIIRNTLDYNLWDKIYNYKLKNKVDDGYIRIGWQGGDSHQKDIASNYNVLIDILKKYNNVKLLIIGWNFSTFSDFDCVRSKIEHIEWFPEHDRYAKNIIDIDIGIAPLEDKIEFNKSKSNIKWLEYSALGIPTIASNVEPYKNIINYENGFLLDNNNELWYNTIVKLIENKELRNRIGTNAKEYTRKYYNCIDEVKRLDEILTDLTLNLGKITLL